MGMNNNNDIHNTESYNINKDNVKLNFFQDYEKNLNKATPKDRLGKSVSDSNLIKNFNNKFEN